MSGNAKHEITLFLHAETDKAVMVNQSSLYNKPPTRHIWLPLSQCEVVRRDVKMFEGGGIQGTEVTLLVPTWLIEKNGLEDLVDA